MFQTISTKAEGKTLFITLNRPDKLNALNSTIIEELSQAIDQLVKDDTLCGAILTGSGKKAFAAGADIKDFPSLKADNALTFSKYGHAVFNKIESCPKPIIAAVNGFALGGGCELAMACHMRVASENAVFGQPEVRLGLLAGYGGTQRLAQLIGRAKATELLITADNISAQTALRYGLVNYVTSSGELLEKCEDILKKVYKQSPLAIALTLDAINSGVNGQNGYEQEAKNFAKAIVSQDGREGVDAFLNKRKPNFTGR